MALNGHSQHPDQVEAESIDIGVDLIGEDEKTMALLSNG